MRENLITREGNQTTYLYQTVSGKLHRVFRRDWKDKDGVKHKKIEQEKGREGKVLPFGSEFLGKYFYVVEGEKACEKMWQFGEDCTTEIMGAGKSLTCWDNIRYKEITLIPDNDAPGRQHFKSLANALAEYNTCLLYTSPSPRDS